MHHEICLLTTGIELKNYLDTLNNKVTRNVAQQYFVVLEACERGLSGSVMVQKVAVRSRVRVWASPCDDWKTLSANPAVNGYLFRIRERLVFSLPSIGQYSISPNHKFISRMIRATAVQ